MKKIGIVVGIVAVLAVVAYMGMSVVLYNTLATVEPKCAGEFADNTPAQFTAAPFMPDLDTVPYFMPDYETVEIPSRDAGVTLSAWYVAGDSGKPTVMVVHGLGVGAPDCKHQPRALLPAGILHRAGYNVLLIDLRNHGDSTSTGGKWAAGTEEYRDVLGAWDWLQSEKGAVPAQIGLLAYSGGTASALIAMGEEPRIPAIWLDSPFVNIFETISDTLEADGYPRFLAPGGILMARLMSGYDLYARTPENAVRGFTDQAVFVVHCQEDATLPVKYAQDMADILKLSADHLWIAEGCGHVQSVFNYLPDYEQKLTSFFSILSAS